MISAVCAGDIAPQLPRAPRRPRRRMRIFLTGFMGAGKTTVGRASPRGSAGRSSISTRRIEELAGETVREIFERAGEAALPRDRARGAAPSDAAGSGRRRDRRRHADLSAQSRARRAPPAWWSG